MGQKKKIRFEAIKTFTNVLENPVGMAGKWNGFFEQSQPITLELACGRGEYTTGLGKRHPNNNFLGVDIKGNRMYIGAKIALQMPLPNVGFLRTQIELIDQYFAKDEVEALWITFPDPQLRGSKAKKRLTHPNFLRKYQQFLVPGGLIHLKTDSPHLYTFTKLVIELFDCKIVTDHDDVYAQSTLPELVTIRTYYEQLDISKSGKIYYLCFTLPTGQLPQNDDLLKQLLLENAD